MENEVWCYVFYVDGINVYKGSILKTNDGLDMCGFIANTAQSKSDRFFIVNRYEKNVCTIPITTTILDIFPDMPRIDAYTLWLEERNDGLAKKIFKMHIEMLIARARDKLEELNTSEQHLETASIIDH